MISQKRRSRMPKYAKKSHEFTALDHERITQLLDYDPETGVFTWRPRLAGTVVKNGYVTLSVDSCRVYAHRLAWFYVHGEWPKEQVDHINGKRDDNSIKNLRLASQSQNSCNGVLRANNTSGYRGVSWSKKNQKWIARIVKHRKQHVLGYFASKEEAYDEYLEAARDLHGEYSRKD